MSDTNILGKTKMVEVIHESAAAAGATLTYEQAQKVYADLLGKMKATLDSPKGSVRLGGIGTLLKRQRKARLGTKPGTHERIQIPAKEKYALRPIRKSASV